MKYRSALIRNRFAACLVQSKGKIQQWAQYTFRLSQKQSLRRYSMHFYDDPSFVPQKLVKYLWSMNRWTLSLLAFVHFLPVQAQDYFCGADSLHHHQLNDSTFRKEQSDTEKRLLHYTHHQGIGSNDTLITLPIVVHIIHKGEAIGTGSNLPDSQIHAAIDGLNDRFAGKIGAGPDTKIRFCLAVRDPKGNYTTGITRVDGTVISGFDTYGMAMFKGQPGGYEKDLKDLSRWPVTDYYNIYIVHNIVNFAGYAYFPGTKADPHDGAVVTARNISYYNPILTHEVGHGLNLYHVFEQTYSSCPSTSNCATMDDRVCDTPPSVDLGSGNCQPYNPCTSSYSWLNNRKNYMSYCINFDRFTEGQIDRMRKSIAITIRDSLRYSLGCIPGHDNDAGITGFLTCDSSIQVILKNFGGNTLTKVNIPLMLDNKVTLTHKWTGSLGTYESDTFRIATNVIQPTVGVNIKCWTEAPNGGKDTVTVNDTFTLDSVFMPMQSGTYSVGSKKSDFPSLSAMAKTLNQRGICGPVVFNLESGTYKEQIKLNAIRGTSKTNTITIQSKKGHRDSVRIEHTPTSFNDNYLIYLDGTDHVFIKNITLTSKGSQYFCTVLRMTNVASHNTIANCDFNAPTGIVGSQTISALVYAGTTTDSSNVFRNSVFRNGAYGIYAKGIDNLGRGVVLDSNQFFDQTFISIFLYNQNSPKIRSNRISANRSNAFNGVYAYICNDDIEITNNIISGTYFKGIEMYGCESNGPKKGLIANNFIRLRASIANSTLHNEGIYINYCDRLQFLHNTIDLIIKDTLGKAFHANFAHNLEVQNNIFANHGDGYILYFTSTDISGNTIDYNNHYTTGKYLGFETKNLKSLIDWKIQTKKDNKSISIDPKFYRDSTYIVCESKLFSAGKFHDQVTMDIDGKKRNLKTPTIGVTEQRLDLLEIGTDKTVCDSIQLMASVGGAEYLWSTGDTTSAITVDSSGRYSVSAKTHCATQHDTIDLIVDHSLEVDLGPDTTLCKQDSIHIQGGHHLVRWSTGDTINSIAVRQTGPYWVEVSNACGSWADTVNLNIESKPTVNLGPDQEHCDSVVLKAPTGYNHSWSDGSDGETLVVLSSGVNWIKVSNQCGITSDSVTVTIHPTPELMLGNDTAACDFYALETMTNYSLNWNTGDTTKQLYIDSSGLFFAELKSDNGCKGISDSVYVTIHQSPTPDLGNDLIEEKGKVIPITTSTRYMHYFWSNGTDKDTLFLNTEDLDSITQLYVEVIDSNGCRGSDTMLITLLDPVSINAVFKDVGIKVYPNPASSVLNIDNFSNETSLHLNVYNQFGQNVLEEEISNAHHQIQTENLVRGIYLVVLKRANGRLVYATRVVLY